ncbi:meiosis-specific kinetochore protein isoform X3 [Camelus ferus]|uniref:Meiosis-specific kinetochore protein isoform X3 n=1 Tax=Camelus ferus TaxID=419612 RepID=A0A8B8SQX7_CAMFR|nr:meiosis-specific kinetochore protein isoform X3 [Camelus ferus]
MWSLRVYTRKKRAERLNLTPTPDLGVPTKAEDPLGPGRSLSARCLKRKGKTHGLPKIKEKAERSGQGGSSSGPLSTRLRGTGEKSLQENSTSAEAQDEKIAPLNESETYYLQVDSSSSNSELTSGNEEDTPTKLENKSVKKKSWDPEIKGSNTGRLSLQHDISSSLLSYSITDSYTENKSFEESLCSLPSPEIFRRSDYCLDREYPKLEENLLCKNSTLLDTSKAVAIEKAPQFPDLSAILGTSSEDYQKCHRKTMMMLTDQNTSPKPKSTSNSESDNADCEVLLTGKTYPSIPEKTEKKPEKDPEPRDTNFEAKLSSHHLKIKVPSSHQRSDVESNAVRSVTRVLLPRPVKSALDTNPSTSDKKSRGLLTSTPSSQTAGLVVPSDTSEICCIIKASPGTRQLETKGVIVKKHKYSPPKDTPPGYGISSTIYWVLIQSKHNLLENLSSALQDIVT